MGKVDVMHPTWLNAIRLLPIADATWSNSAFREWRNGMGMCIEKSTNVERGLKKSKQNRLSGTTSETTPVGPSTRSSERKNPIGSGMCWKTWLAMNASKLPCSSRGTAASRGPCDQTMSTSTIRDVSTFESLRYFSTSCSRDAWSTTVVSQPSDFGAIGVASGPSSRIPIERSIEQRTLSVRLMTNEVLRL